MRPLEFAALSVLALSLALFLVPAKSRPVWARFLPAAAAVLLVLQLLVEGHRWQLDLAYPLCAGLLLASWLGSRTTWHHAIVVILALLGGLGLLVAALFATGSPMFELPEPTGSHAVGVTKLQVTDPSREETFTHDPDDHRELMLTIWYPAAVVRGSGKPVSSFRRTAPVP